MTLSIRTIQKLLSGMLIAVLSLSPAFALADNDRSGMKDEDRDKQEHLDARIALRFDSFWCRYLPPGIAKRFPACVTDPSDTSAPVISNIRIDSIDRTSARVKFDTNELTRAQIFYGVQAGLSVSGPRSVSGAVRGYDTSHEIVLRGLSENTTYYVLVRATDRSGHVSTSAELSFRTLPSDARRDTTPPEIRNVVIRNVTDTTATITWQTDEPSTTVAWYRAEPLAVRLFSDRNGSEVGSDSKSLTIDHSITLAGLNAGTTYIVMVGGKDASGNMGSSAEHRFMTQKVSDTAAPVVYNLSVRIRSENKSAIVSWSTNEPADSQIFYATTRDVHGSNSFVVKDATLTENHELTLANLQSGIPYYFEVQSKDASGNLVTTPLYVIQI